MLQSMIDAMIYLVKFSNKKAFKDDTMMRRICKYRLIGQEKAMNAKRPWKVNLVIHQICFNLIHKRAFKQTNIDKKLFVICVRAQPPLHS